MLNLAKILGRPSGKFSQPAKKPSTRGLLNARLRHGGWSGLDPLEQRVMMSASMGIDFPMGPAIVTERQPTAKSLTPNVGATVSADSQGLIVLEAEQFTASFNRGGLGWTPTSNTGFSGGTGMVVGPNNGVSIGSNIATTSPELDFTVNFTQTGVYYLWIKGVGLTGNDDSVHAGLDGVVQASSDRIDGFTKTGNWSQHTMDGVVATVNVAAAGVHTFSLYMREDGFIADQIVLTQDATYVPSGIVTSSTTSTTTTTPTTTPTTPTTPTTTPTTSTTPTTTSGSNWFTLNLHDAGLINLSSSLDADGTLSRGDMMSILTSTGADGTVSATELTDLRTLVSNGGTLGMPDYVRVLSGYVVNPDIANTNYLGAPLGNLTAGSTSSQLNNLIGKWFLGSDHPVALPYGGGTAYAYKTSTLPLFQTGATYTDIHQGNLGDCYLLAALGSVAQRQPAAIQNMFIDNGDGTYTVRYFNNGVADFVTVDRALPVTSVNRFAFQGSNLVYNGTTGDLWAALAEKAFVQINEHGWSGHGNANAYQAINGGWMASVDSMILGRPATTISNTSMSTVINALAANKMVTGGSRSTSTTQNIVTNHAYIITGYDSVTLTFTLYNPWGSNQPPALTWSQLSYNFPNFVIA